MESARATGNSAGGTISEAVGETILIVDDNRDAVDMLGTLLETSGYRVRRAISAYEAVEALDEDLNIRLVLSDVRMPGVDGFDFLRVVRQRFPALPIVLITGYPITNDDFPPRGATILEKPFGVEELRRVVTESLAIGKSAGAEAGARAS